MRHEPRRNPPRRRPHPRQPEWLATYSASQVAAICGLSEWDTPRSIYDAKKGIVPPQPQTDVQAAATSSSR
ncbi:hypothetical protein GS532_22610 [Rhodococcus hoagii]|nr:hypothetical protein [Prescottella equi]